MLKVKDNVLDSDKIGNLSGIIVNAKQSGAKLDGATDDYSVLQSFIDSLPDGATVQFPSNCVFNISHPLVITKGIKLLFNGSKLQYTGTADLGTNNGANRYYGAITIQGSLDNTKQLSVTAVTPSYFDASANQTTNMSKITTSATDATQTFAIGDVVYIEVWNFATWGSWSQTFADNPAIVRAAARILNISGGDIYLDCNPDFIFDSPSLQGTITKMNPVDNVIIENLSYEDLNNASVPSSPTNTDRQSWVGGIHAYYTTNLKIKNFDSKRHRFPSVMMNWSYNYIIEDFHSSDPRAISGGCGYGIQNNGCCHGHFLKLRGKGNRHLLDFSGGGHHVVEDAFQFDKTSTFPMFDCHGIGEFDITFRDCVGMFSAGNGISLFPDMTTGITLENFTGEIYLEWVNDIRIINSKVFLFELATTCRVPRIEIINSTVIGLETALSYYASSRGGVYNNSCFIMDNVRMTVNNIAFQSNFGDLVLFVGYEVFKIVNSHVINNFTTDLSFHLQKCKYIHILDNPKFQNVGVLLENTTSATESINSVSMDNGVLTVENTNFNETNANASNYSFINMNDGTGITNFKMQINHNLFNAAGTSRWLRFGTAATFTGAIYLSAEGNTLLNNITEFLNGVTPKATKSNNNGPSLAASSILKDLKAEGRVSITSGWTNVTVNLPSDYVQPDTNYGIVSTPEWNAGAVWVTGKTTTQFTLNWATAPGSASMISYKLVR